MKLLIKICLAVLFLFSTAGAQKISEELNSSNYFLDSRSFDANNIVLSRISNMGDFNTANWKALEYGTVNARRILFDAGIWVTGIIDSKIHAGIKYYSTNYSPGPIINGQPAIIASPDDSLKYRVYKIFRGNDLTNPDYAEWPVEFGAPVNNNGEPKLFGDQLVWTAYNLFDPSKVDSTKFTEEQYGILPIEVQQKIYGRNGNLNDDENIFHNIVFIEWTIINKGTTNIDSAFIGLWSDIDFYNVNSNLPAVDRKRQTGYLWSGTNYQPSLGGVPPAVGFTLLYGPIKPNIDSTAVFKGKTKDGYYNLPLSSFHAIGDESSIDPLYGLPQSEKQIYSVANGFANSGGIIIDPTTSRSTKFPFSGNPVDSTGWLFPEEETSNGAGFLLFTGPIDLAPSDTQWVMTALVPGVSNENNLMSIEEMRHKIDLIRALPYDSLAFGKDSLVTGINDPDNELPKTYSLSQNYPNPFNPTTTIEFEIPKASTDVKLSVYNVLGQEVKILLNKNINAGKYSVTFDASDLPSGVYIYSLKSGNHTLNRKMLLLK